MAVKKILPFGEPLLRSIAAPVTAVDSKISGLLKNLTDTLYAEEGRAGLAAPQIGASQRVIVMDCGEGLIELINPEIVEFRGEQIGPEACLSLPGYTGIVPRAEYVLVKTWDREGRTLQIEAHEFLARCMQHEIDHLNGILYIDRIQDDLFFEDETEHKADLTAVLRHSKPDTTGAAESK